MCFSVGFNWRPRENELTIPTLLDHPGRTHRRTDRQNFICREMRGPFNTAVLLFLLQPLGNARTFLFPLRVFP